MTKKRASSPKQAKDYDLLVIGGGINGAGIARDAAGRGLSVLLVEAQDLASATSSASTKLIHGGLRYLEYYEFRLVKEALSEREVLLNMAPHIIWPMQFILPHDKSLRPKWMIRAGLFLYDYLAGRKKLNKSKGVNLAIEPEGEPLRDHYKKGFAYSDCWVEDSRLVVLNARDAANKGAEIRTQTVCTHLRPHKGVWQAALKGTKTLHETTVTAKKVVNAAGPWVHGVLEASGLTGPQTPRIKLVKGSHIVVPRQFNGDHAYILQQPDKRIVFAIPYEYEFTLIGTTDVPYEDDPTNVKISDEEIEYLCNAFNLSFKKKIKKDDILYSYSGVRPLFDDGDEDPSAVTRDYKLIMENQYGPPILSVFGGKITTYRKLAEQAVNMLTNKKPWTGKGFLPGGDIEKRNFDAFVEAQLKRYPKVTPELIFLYARAYGTLMDDILDGAKSTADLGQHLGGPLYEAEVRYLVEREWARTVDDILFRRTKLGLHINSETLQNLRNLLHTIFEEEKDTAA